MHIFSETENGLAQSDDSGSDCSQVCSLDSEMHGMMVYRWEIVQEEKSPMFKS